MVTQTRQTGQASPTKLAFREKLVAKSQTTDTYLRKLKALHTNLNELDQDNVDLNSLSTIKKDLLLPGILLHNDRGVKAYAACCLVDILGLYAPEAPFTEDELCDIFKFIIVQLGKGLKLSEDTYYPQYYHILESLSSVKSIVLICDLPNGDDLIHSIFRDFFALIRKEFNMQMENFMAEILVAIIDECQSFPAKCMDIILAQFTDRNISTEQPAFRLAVNICRQTDDKLQRHVSMYFTDVIVEHSEQEDLAEIRKAHDLIKHIHAHCPNLLHSVIPQLEEELKAEGIAIRALATEVVGEMYADKGGVDLARKYPTTFKVWLGRFNDRAASIRTKSIDATRAILNHHAELRDLIREPLQNKLLDPDERVRAAVCRLYGQLDFEVILHHVPREDLESISGRASDKKQTVRTEALKTLSKMYNLAYPQIENNDLNATNQFAWIPNTVFPLLGLSTEGRQAVEQVIADYILPLPVASSSSKDKSAIVEIDEVRWTDRLLNTIKYLEDDKALNALLVCTNLKLGQPSPAQRFLDACIANNGGVIDEDEEGVKRRLAHLIKVHAGQFHDQAKAAEDLQHFADLNDQGLYTLLKRCIDPQTDVKSLVKRREDFLKKMAAIAVGAASTMKVFLRHATYHILNQSAIPTLLKRMDEGEREDASEWAILTARHAHLLLKYAAKHLPALFKPHQSLLNTCIATEAQTALTAISLQALSSLVRSDPSLGTSDKRLIERYARYAVGLGEKHAKFAARLLAHTPDQIAACTRVVDTLAGDLSNDEPELLVAHVAALAQFVLSAPEAFESRSDVITEYLYKHLLMEFCPPPPIPGKEADEDADEDADEEEGEKAKADEEVEEWIEDEELPALYRAKVLALKTFRNRCKAYSKLDNAGLVSGPPLKVFNTLIAYNGTLCKEGPEDPILMSRMRLQAAVCLVQLSAVSVDYSKAILPHFQRIALMAQDSAYNVRQIFQTKFLPVLYLGKLSEIYNIVPFLSVHDPDNELKATAAGFVSSRIRRLSPDVRVRSFDSMFIRLLHFLAHHPDFPNYDNPEDHIKDHAAYIKNFLELIATPDNISLLYHFAQKGKTVQDIDPDYNEKFWMMCDLAQEIIRIFVRWKQWTLPAFPGKVKLPRDILRPQKTLEEANAIAKQNFLRQEDQDWVADMYKPEEEEKKPRKQTKRKANGSANGAAKRTKKKRKSESRDDDDDDDVDDDVEEDEGMATSSDVEMADRDPSEDEDDGVESGEEQLGRGARQKAKRKARKKAKSKG